MPPLIPMVLVTHYVCKGGINVEIIALETATAYFITVQYGEQSWTYEWGKEPPEGQSAEVYLQSCKQEAELLAEHELAKQVEPTPVDV